MHVVFGAGPLGLAVTKQLRAQGLSARLATRTGRPGATSETGGVEWVRADAADPASAAAVCAGATVVYHCAGAPYNRWPELLPGMLEGIIAGARSAGATLVYGDNLYMYGPVAGPLTETLPDASTSTKGALRARLARRLLDAHKRGELRAAIGRGSDFFGPYAITSHAGERVFPRALAGKAAEVVGDPEKLHTFTFIDDFARALVILGSREEALGHAWHVPNAPTVTTRAFVEQVFRAAGTRPRLRAAPRWLLGIVGLFDPVVRELRETLYQFEQDFVVDSNRFTETFGMQSTPLDDAIGQTLDWWRRTGPV